MLAEYCYIDWCSCAINVRQMRPAPLWPTQNVSDTPSTVDLKHRVFSAINSCYSAPRHACRTRLTYGVQLHPAVLAHDLSGVRTHEISCRRRQADREADSDRQYCLKLSWNLRVRRVWPPSRCIYVCMSHAKNTLVGVCRDQA